MKRIKSSEKRQGVLFAKHYIGDRLPEDSEVYLFDSLIDLLDLSPITDKYSEEGGSMYSPRDKFAIILYAYFEGVTSSIQMARLVARDVAYIYLAGGHLIKSKTLRTFRLEHKDVFPDLLLSVIQLGQESGLIELDKLFALDGSKFGANASGSQSKRKKKWESTKELIQKDIESWPELIMLWLIDYFLFSFTRILAFLNY